MAGKGEDVNTQQTKENKENEAQDQTEGDKVERVNKLPLTRIKHLIKMDPDVTLASQDAVIMIAKAAVSFNYRSPTNLDAVQNYCWRSTSVILFRNLKLK